MTISAKVSYHNKYKVINRESRKISILQNITGYLTLKSTNSYFFNSKECLLIGFYTEINLYSQPTWLNSTLNKSLFIGGTRGRLNNHCNNLAYLAYLVWSDEERRLAFFILLPSLLTFDCIEIMWAVYGCTRHWMMNQPMLRRSGYNEVMDHFLKVCKWLAWFLCLFSWTLYSQRVLALIPIRHFNPYCIMYNSIDCIAIGQTLRKL